MERFSLLAPTLYARGWRGIIPLVTGEKRPAIPRWERFNAEDQTPEQLDCLCARFAAYNCGIGAVAGNGVLSLDLDIYDAAAAARALVIVEDLCDVTPLVRVGNAPKTMAFYRSDAPGLRRNPQGLAVEVYPGGRPATGQVVLHGRHPDTGQPYQWTRHRPADVDLRELPWVHEDTLDDLIDALAADPLVRAARTLPRAVAGRHGGCVGLTDAALARVSPGGLAGWVASAKPGARHGSAVAAVGELLALGLDDETAELEALECAFREVKPEATLREWNDIVQWARVKLAPRMPRRELLRRLGLEVRHAA